MQNNTNTPATMTYGEVKQEFSGNPSCECQGVDAEFSKTKLPSHIMQYFEYAHLPPHLQMISKRVADLAFYMDQSLMNGPEKSAGLRKLLEAKDCFVRQTIV